ncbi:hypothetical protein Ancab_011931 [Ancistrocladus abbreviatus]
MSSIPLHAWTTKFISKLASLWGELVFVEEATRQNQRFDLACFLVKTSIYEVIDETRCVHINGQHFTLCILEENFGGNWKITHTHHPEGTRCSGKKTATLAAISGKEAGSLSSFVSDFGEATATHYGTHRDDPKTKMLDQIGRSGDSIGAFNDPFPCLGNTTITELQNTLLDDDTFNAAVGTNDGNDCKEAEDVLQTLTLDQPSMSSLKFGPLDPPEQAGSYLPEWSFLSPA